jgi:hypothetical protein
LCPSEFSVLLLDPSRYRCRSSSYGIGCSFRVFHPPKYRRNWFGNPAVPLVVYLGYAVFLRRIVPTTFRWPVDPLFELHLPLESYPAQPTRLPQQSDPLLGLLVPTAHGRIRGPLSQGCPPCFVPPSGFGYPLDGLRPRVPGRFFFTPTALLGFTLRRFPLSRGFHDVSAGTNLPTVSSSSFSAARRHQTGLMSLGFQVYTSRECLVIDRGFRPTTTGASHGVRPSRVRSRQPCRDFSQAPLARFAKLGDASPNPTGAPEYQSALAWSRPR